MFSSLRGYVEQHIPVGSFLEAVISNDLKQAVQQADDTNIRNIPAFVGYLYNNAPSECWGSKEKYKRWLAPKENNNA
jgi:hypothetical protein